MSEKLDAVKAEYIEKLRKVKLLEAGIPHDSVSVYEKYITAEKPTEIEKQAQEIYADIKQQNTATDFHIDKRSWNPFTN